MKMVEVGEIDKSSPQNFSLEGLRDWLRYLRMFQEALRMPAASDEIPREEREFLEVLLEAVIMEFRFLRTSFKCIARDENLKVISTSAIGPSWSRFSAIASPGERFEVLPDVLDWAMNIRSKVSYLYDLISVTSPSYNPMTSDLVVELIDDITQNLEDLLSSTASWVVSVESQISVLKGGLRFLRNFLDFAANRCSQLEKFNDLLTHSEVLAIDAARASYSCLTHLQNEEGPLEMKVKLSDLLQKIKPLKPEVREMYIGVLRASEPLESFHSSWSNRRSLWKAESAQRAFVDSLQESLLDILKSDSGFEPPVHDRLKLLRDEFRFLRAIILDPQGERLMSWSFDDLLRSVDNLTIESGSLIFSLYCDEVTEELAKQMNLVLEHMNRVKSKCREIYLSASKPSRSKFPRTDGLGFIQFFLENLKELLGHRDNRIDLLKHHIKSVQEELESLTPVFQNMERKLNQNEELKSLWTKVIGVAYHAEYVVDSIVIHNIGPAWYYMLWLDDVIDEIQQLKADVTELNSKIPSDPRVVGDATKHSSSTLFSLEDSSTSDLQIVGFEDEAEKITDLLIQGSGAELDVVSIFGMPGLGKTTLAKSIYNSLSVKRHFHVRAWCCVSQVYQKKDLLLTILGHVIELKDRHYKMDEADLGLLLKRNLTGKRYLVVMDDIWNIEPLRELQLSFPDSYQGSRIMLTTRIRGVALQAKLHSYPHFLRQFKDEESWKLLQDLLFSKESCPSELKKIAYQIAISCKGLPLSVVLIAGLLATNKSRYFWEQVAQSFSSRIIGNQETQALDIIGLSYEHLPNHLKPCFLYFGAFLEDQEIPVKKLVRLWTAEGFARENEGRKIEETAEDFLKELIDRSLVTVAKRGADGGIKACSIHDLIFHFCKAKSQEENFLQQIDQVDDLLSSADSKNIVQRTHWDDRLHFFDYSQNSLQQDDDLFSSISKYDQHRLRIYCKRDKYITSLPSGSHLRSILLFAASDHAYPQSLLGLPCMSISYKSKLLRVLDIMSLKIRGLPSGLEMLVLLKYLAVWIEAESIPKSIASLGNLETFVLKVNTPIHLPESIWKMRKLRHLHVSNLAIFYGDEGERDTFSLEEQSSEDTNQFNSLQTISTLCFQNGREEKMLRKIPNIRKLSCEIVDAIDGSNHGCHFPALELLNNIESVNVSFSGKSLPPLWEINFPLRVKRLTVSDFRLQWTEFSIIGRLENLEVLKLRDNAFEGPLWDMEDVEFPKLKHLELYRMELEKWIVQSENFPCLRQLRLLSCDELTRVPYCLAEVQTLEMIEVKWCPKLDVDSIQKIEEEQVNTGNSKFKAIIPTYRTQVNWSDESPSIMLESNISELDFYNDAVESPSLLQCGLLSSCSIQ